MKTEKIIELLRDRINEEEKYRDVLLEYVQVRHEISELEDELPSDIKDKI